MVDRIRRLICRYRGHKLNETPITRGKLRGTAVGCTRCDTLLGVKTQSVTMMTVPRRQAHR